MLQQARTQTINAQTIMFELASGFRKINVGAIFNSPGANLVLIIKSLPVWLPL